MHLLVTGAWQGFKENETILKEMDHEISFLQWEKDPLPCEPEWVEGIIGNGIFQNHKIEQFTNLRYIQLTSAGFDRVPMEYVNEHNIEIHNARGVYSIPMAEFAIGGILQLYKMYPHFSENQKNHQWDKIRTIRELNKSKVLIIGCGATGYECAVRLKAFGCEVIGVNRTVQTKYPSTDSSLHDSIPYDSIYPLDMLDTLVTDADIVILSIALTDETKNIMNRNRIHSMKEGAILVNIARGPLADQKALEDLLPEKHLGAVLDVFDEEPLDTDSSLWNMDNVIITPHNSFVSNRNAERLNSLIIDNISK